MEAEWRKKRRSERGERMALRRQTPPTDAVMPAVAVVMTVVWAVVMVAAKVVAAAVRAAAVIQDWEEG